jgi:hypothetical protein
MVRSIAQQRISNHAPAASFETQPSAARGIDAAACGVAVFRGDDGG